MTVENLPRVLADISTVTAAAWRTEYKLGTLGHRYLLYQRGQVVADTGWHDTFVAAASAHAGQFVLLSIDGTARFHTDDDDR